MRDDASASDADGIVIVLPTTGGATARSASGEPSPEVAA